MKEFKAGDKVYFPRISSKILTVYEDIFPSYPIKLRDDTYTYEFTHEGKFFESDVTPSLFHATQENKEKLEALYGMKFEAPPVKPTSKDIIQALLNNGQKYVPCYVSSGIKAPNGGSYLDFIVCVHNDGRFYNKLGEGWKYATPFDPKTGQPITELPQ